jgi:hypothetical protein
VIDHTNKKNDRSRVMDPDEQAGVQVPKGLITPFLDYK